MNAPRIIADIIIVVINHYGVCLAVRFGRGTIYHRNFFFFCGTHNKIIILAYDAKRLNPKTKCGEW